MAIVLATITLSHPAITGTGTNSWHLEAPGEPLGNEAAFTSAMGALHGVYDGFNDITAGGRVARWDGTFRTVGEGSVVFGSGPGWTSTNGTSQGALPQSTCIVAGWTTASATRSGKGRTFTSPIAQNANGADGRPTIAALGSARAAAGGVVTWNVGSGAAKFVVYSPKTGAAFTITGFRVGNQFAVLRSRRD